MDKACRQAVPEGDSAWEEGVFQVVGPGGEVHVLLTMVRSCSGAGGGKKAGVYCYKVVDGFIEKK